MRKIYNERHLEKEEYATNLDVLRELDKRTELNEYFSTMLQQLEAKETGVNKVLKLIHYYAKEHWFYMTDLALDAHEMIGCDLLLMTRAGIYSFEINDYEGVFEIEDSVCKLNGQKFDGHPIEKINQITSQLKKDAVKNAVQINIQGAALFPNPHNEVISEQKNEAIEIVTADQLDNYLKRIIQEEKDYNGPAMNRPMHLSWLGQIDRHFPMQPMEVPTGIHQHLYKGIVCCHCGSFEINIGDPYISCACGMHESFEEAIVRTICEYGVLNNDKPLEVYNLLHFFDYQISKEHLMKSLDKHFTPII